MMEDTYGNNGERSHPVASRCAGQPLSGVVVLRHTAVVKHKGLSWKKQRSEKEPLMVWLKMGLPMLAVIALNGAPAFAADLETQVIDKNCWIEVFDDDDFDTKDAHVKLQGPKEFASLTDVAGKNWNNDIESVIV